MITTTYQDSSPRMSLGVCAIQSSKLKGAACSLEIALVEDGQVLVLVRQALIHMRLTFRKYPISLSLRISDWLRPYSSTALTHT